MSDFRSMNEYGINTRVLSLYEVTYVSDGIKQIKGLVTDEDYDTIIKPITKAINIIEDDNKGKPNTQSKLLKYSLKIMFGDYANCIKQTSPLGKSIKTGILCLPPQQGGDHKVTWKCLQKLKK
jgi:hypothetical protein